MDHKHIPMFTEISVPGLDNVVRALEEIVIKSEEIRKLTYQLISDARDCGIKVEVRPQTTDGSRENEDALPGQGFLEVTGEL